MSAQRKINRIYYKSPAAIIFADTHESLIVDVQDVSPLGMGIIAPSMTPEIIGKDIIIITDTLIMYAKVVRQVKNEDGTFNIGIEASKFKSDILGFMLNRIVEADLMIP